MCKKASNQNEAQKSNEMNLIHLLNKFESTYTMELCCDSLVSFLYFVHKEFPFKYFVF